MGLSDDTLVIFENALWHTKCSKLNGRVAAIKNTQHHRLTVHTGQSGDAHVKLIAAKLVVNTPVLRQALFADVEPGHQLQARGHGSMNFHRQLFNAGHDAVDPAAHVQRVLVRFKVNVAGV